MGLSVCFVHLPYSSYLKVLYVEKDVRDMTDVLYTCVNMPQPAQMIQARWSKKPTYLPLLIVPKYTLIRNTQRALSSFLQML